MSVPPGPLGAARRAGRPRLRASRTFAAPLVGALALSVALSFAFAAPAPATRAAPAGQAPEPTRAAAPALPAEDLPLAPPKRPPSMEAGRALYQEHCAACHGAMGEGRGSMAERLPSPPPSLADPERVRALAPLDGYDAVTNGRMERMMPPFRSLDDAERWDALHGALQFYYTPFRLARAEARWETSCASCHGAAAEDLLGDPVRGDALWGRSQDDLLADMRSDERPEHGALEGLDDEALFEALDHLRAQGFAPLDVGPLRGDGLLAGRVLLAEGEAPAEGATVTSLAFAAGLPDRPVSATVGADGRFLLEGLVTGEAVERRAYATYQGAEYFPEASDETSGETSGAQEDAELEFRVYESATDVPLRVSALHMVVAPSEEPGLVEVIERWVLANDSRLAAVAGEDGAAVRYGLLASARGLRFDDARIRPRARVEGDLLLDGLAVPPGGREMIVSYEAAYRGEELDLSRDLPLPIDLLTVSVTEPGARVEGEGLASRDTARIGEQDVERARWTELPAGERLRGRVTGLPEAAPGGAQDVLAVVEPSPVPREALTLAVLAVGALGIALALAYPAMSARAGHARRRRWAEGERARHVAALGELERRKASGELAPRDYQARKAALMDRALAAARRAERLRSAGAAPQEREDAAP